VAPLAARVPKPGRRCGVRRGFRWAGTPLYYVL
jgi:hypothetical protein